MHYTSTSAKFGADSSRRFSFRVRTDICLVLETAALCDIYVRSAVYKSSYLLTYTRSHRRNTDETDHVTAGVG